MLPAAGRIRRPGQLTDPEVSERFALENFPDYYHEFGGLLDWYNPWDAVLESTSDGYWRAGQWIDHKEKADQARDLAVGEDHRVEKVLIWERHRGQYRSEHALVEGRDVVVDDVIDEFRGQRVEPEHMRADETLFLMYTSGSTGKPNAARHSAGGYLAYRHRDVETHPGSEADRRLLVHCRYRLDHRRHPPPVGVHRTPAHIRQT